LGALGKNIGIIGAGRISPLALFVCRNARNESGQSDEVTGHIYINGQIVPDQSKYADEWGVVSMRTVIDALNTLPEDITKLLVHINSPGGYVDEGFAILNTLKTFKKDTGVKITTRADGQCASIATIVMFAGDVREIFNNSEPFIHNPWLDPWSLPSQMEATDLEAIAKQMRQQEDRILDFYVAETGADREILAALMQEQTALTPDKALELKFATVILTDIKAMAKLTINKTTKKMAKPKKTVAQAAAELKAAAKKAGILALNLTTTDGKALEVLTDKDNPAEGDEVKIAGEAAPDDEYEIENGDTLTVTAGKIETITPAEGETETAAPEAATEAQASLKDLQTKFKKLEAQNKTLAAKLAAMEKKEADEKKESDDLVDLVQNLTQRLENTKTAFIPSQRQSAGAQDNAGNQAQKSRAQEAIDRKNARLEEEKKNEKA
jgi:ATP-dependent protease ClpP protease subunit